MRPVGGNVRVDADLDVRVDGHTVAVTATGDRVQVEISDPAAVLGVLTSTALPVGTSFPFDRHTIGRVADTLTDGGLTLTVIGPSGRLATLGSDARGGRWTRLLVGNRHVTIGSWSAVRSTLRPLLRSVLGRTRVRLAGRVTRR